MGARLPLEALDAAHLDATARLHVAACAKQRRDLVRLRGEGRDHMWAWAGCVGYRPGCTGLQAGDTGLQAGRVGLQPAWRRA